jgi:hypothetical protein
LVQNVLLKGGGLVVSCSDWDDLGGLVVSCGDWDDLGGLGDWGDLGSCGDWGGWACGDWVGRLGRLGRLGRGAVIWFYGSRLGLATNEGSSDCYGDKSGLDHLSLERKLLRKIVDKFRKLTPGDGDASFFLRITLFDKCHFCCMGF